MLSAYVSLWGHYSSFPLPSATPPEDSAPLGSFSRPRAWPLLGLPLTSEDSHVPTAEGQENLWATVCQSRQPFNWAANSCTESKWSSNVPLGITRYYGTMLCLDLILWLKVYSVLVIWHVYGEVLQFHNLWWLCGQSYISCPCCKYNMFTVCPQVWVNQGYNDFL